MEIRTIGTILEYPDGTCSFKFNHPYAKELPGIYHATNVEEAMWCIENGKTCVGLKSKQPFTNNTPDNL